MAPKQNRDNTTNPSKPLAPTLATGRVKSPITPRLAGHPFNATAPLSRGSARSNTPDTIKSNAPREDLSTPVKTLISKNITPRSSSRKSRVESTSPHSTPNATPNGTPTGSRSTSTLEGLGIAKRPVGSSGLGTSSKPHSAVGGGVGPTSPPLGTSTYPGAGNARGGTPGREGSMFFHTNETQTLQTPVPPARKSPAFFYANGALDDSGRALDSPSPPLSTVSTRSHRSQFFRADGSTDDDRLPLVPSMPSPPKLSASPVPLQPVQPPLQNAPSFRPPSPAKDNFHLSYRKGASQIIRPDDRPKATSILPAATFDTPRQRSTSVGSKKSQFHQRTSSLSSIESASSKRRQSMTTPDKCGLTPLQTLFSLKSENSNLYSSAPPSARIPSPVLESDDPINSSDISIKPTITAGRSRQTSTASNTFSIPQSPIKGNSGLPPQNLAQMTELAANARRERKVLDLEISNSSLLAINRQLEREVKKQKTEIRRFRRLSRAGRLSSLTLKSTSGDGGDFDGEAGGGALDNCPEEEDFDSDDNSTEGSDSVASSSLSPSALAAKDARKIEKDSKRLQLDLNKHRELLVDSQKMNQSLKRCMAWSEDMIIEGKRALEYKVYVSDVKLGGRILEREVHEEDPEADYSLLSSWTPSPIAEIEGVDGMLGLGLDLNNLGRKSWQSEEADSGIEVESARGSKDLPDGNLPDPI